MTTSELYPDVAELAAELLDEYGRDLVVQRITTVDNLAAGTSTPTPTDYAVRGVTYPIRESFALREAARVREGSEALLIAAQGLAVKPEVGWAVFLAATTADATTRRRIVAVEPLEPADLPILYELEVVR